MAKSVAREVSDKVVAWDTPMASSDSFTFPATHENASPGTISKAVFSGFPGAALNLEYSDSDKLGTFTR
jgi:hypothetical protein